MYNYNYCVQDDALEGPILNLKQGRYNFCWTSCTLSTLCFLHAAIELSMPKQLTLYEEELNKARSESTSSLIDKVCVV